MLNPCLRRCHNHVVHFNTCELYSNHSQWIKQRLTFTQCPNCSYFIPTWKRLPLNIITHTPTASDQEKTECALCAQLFISISPVLRGTKWAFKLQGPESSVAGGQVALRCLGGGGIRSFTGVAHLAVYPWFWKGFSFGRERDSCSCRHWGDRKRASSRCRGLRRSAPLPEGTAERNAINSQTKEPLQPPQRKHMWWSRLPSRGSL